MEFLLIERVQHGAAWLDEVKPGWERLINLGTLSIANPDNCVCAQVFTTEGTGVEGGWTYAVEREDFPRLSFTSDVPTALWAEEIERRLKNMDIGKEGEPFVVEPVEDPFRKTTTPEPERERPQAPVREREREEELIPA